MPVGARGCCLSDAVSCWLENGERFEGGNCFIFPWGVLERKVGFEVDRTCSDEQVAIDQSISTRTRDNSDQEVGNPNGHLHLLH
jgi:hypothetical protein